jgi:predicted hotdog family 3-hydroxylacyl-ACP dehydratase
MDTRIPILDLIPQRPPFVLVDAFVAEEDYSVFRVPEDHVLVRDGFLSEAGLVENIAQTAAARAGFLCLSEGKPVPLGYIGAVQHLDVAGLPAVSQEIRTTIEVKHQVFNSTSVRGTAYAGDQVLATCDMKIFIV